LQGRLTYTIQLMDIGILNKIFTYHSLIKPNSFNKIESGFTNQVYLIDDIFILKICSDKNNERAFRQEAILYRYFIGKLPVPELILYDDSKKVFKKNFMIYYKIKGDTLYSIWHNLSQETRRDLVKQLCKLLKKINSTNFKELPKELGFKTQIDWKNFMLSKIETYLSISQIMGTLSHAEITKIKNFVNFNAGVLEKQELALVYWDPHFDNVLVKDNKIVGLIDFERTQIASIDFVLDTVKRMVDFPKKYMSQSLELLANAEDYQDLLVWYEEFYPELFSFTNLKRRLDLYAIAHDLEDLENWPVTQSIKDNIMSIVTYRTSQV
jgi:aminoglycoside phosphotransferase (APT) family kinase protein